MTTRNMCKPIGNRARNTPVILWIELTASQTGAPLITRLSNACQVYSLNKVDEIPAKIAEFQPHLLCFDYDHPDLAGLSALRRAKRQYPSLPILMLTQPNSEALAVWALRTRVWDYLTKPVDFEELLARITILSQLPERTNAQCRQISMPEQTIPVHIRLGGNTAKQATFPAITYVYNHFHEKVPLDTVAKHCQMEPGSFSRAFKRENGLTFREFLMRYRIRKAVELLKHSNTTVLDIAFAVGFNDPSQFSRMFKRYVGVTPSKYRTHGKSRLAARADERLSI